MGFTRLIAKWGGIGGTARWAAKAYLRISRDKPDEKIENILSVMVDERYSRLPDERAMRLMQGHLREKRLRHLGLFVVLMLKAEAWNSPNARAALNEYGQTAMSVVAEELRKKGVPEELVGWNQPGADLGQREGP